MISVYQKYFYFHHFSPVGTYQNLIKAYRLGDLDFSCVTTINLDEYKGISPDNDQSYRYFMDTSLFHHINIKKENIYAPNGLELDAEKACNSKGINLQLHNDVTIIADEAALSMT